MSIKNNIIEFYPYDDEVPTYSEPPLPGIHANLPTWVRSMSKYQNGATKFVYEGESNLSLKNCIPFTESLTAGYVITTYCDIQVRKLETGQTRITWATSMPIDPVTSRANIQSGIPDIEGYESLQFNWMPLWSVITKPGYSCQFIHPINRMDLPFYTLGGVLDTDKWGEAGNHPFLLKKGFEGIIPKGTPIVQVIPFKRENWKAKVTTNSKDNLYIKKLRQKDSVFKGWYKKFAWSNKSYR